MENLKNSQSKIIEESKILFNAKMKQLIKKYINLTKNMKNVDNDIMHISALHYKFVKNSDKKAKFTNYGTYIDDIHFQKVILEKDLDILKEMTNMILRKAYRDFFRLYYKIIKEIIVVYTEIQQNHKNDDLYTNKVKSAEDMMNEMKKKLLTNVRIYKESDETELYSIVDIRNIFNLIMQRLDEYDKYINELLSYINKTEQIESDGYLIKNLLISIISEQEKMRVNEELFRKLLDDILDTHLRYITKYSDRSDLLADEIKESTNKIIINSNNNSLQTNNVELQLASKIKSSFTNTMEQFSPTSPINDITGLNNLEEDNHDETSIIISMDNKLDNQITEIKKDTQEVYEVNNINTSVQENLVNTVKTNDSIDAVFPKNGMGNFNKIPDINNINLEEKSINSNILDIVSIDSKQTTQSIPQVDKKTQQHIVNMQNKLRNKKLRK